MNDCFLNIRFGARHFQFGFWFARTSINQYHIDNKPAKWFEIY